MKVMKTVLLVFLIIYGDLAIAAQNTEQDKRSSLQSATPMTPEMSIVDKWRGTWEVKAMRRQPQPAALITYTETFEWVLDGRFLRSETSRKSDGGKTMSMVWYDVLTKSYRYAIYYSEGYGVELPPPTWHEATQTMEWSSGLFAPVSYTGYATFADRDTIRWKSLLKDWKGSVVLDIEGTSVRRK